MILTSQRFWRLLQTNVNVFLKNLPESRKEKELLPLLDIGRCGLHAIHNSFKTAVKIGSDWELQKLLKTMCKFLQGTPTRRPLYENLSESLGYLFQICGHRWYENKKKVLKEPK